MGSQGLPSVGDKIRLKETLVGDDGIQYVSRRMTKYAGRTVKVKAVTRGGNFHIEQDGGDGFPWFFSPGMIAENLSER